MMKLSVLREFGENSGAAFVGDGKHLLVCRGERGDPMEAELIELATGKSKWTRDVEMVTDVFAVGRDGFILRACETLDPEDDVEFVAQELQVHALAKGKLRLTVPATQPGLVAVDPLGELIASTNGYGAVDLYSVRTGELLDQLPSEGTQGLAFSSDGKMLAVQDGEGLKIRDAALPSDVPFRVASLDADEPVNELGGELAFRPGTSTLALAQDRAIKLIDARTDEVQAVIATTEAERVEGISLLAFSPDGKLLLSSTSSRGLIGLWDVEKATFLGHLAELGEGVTKLQFHPDGRQVLLVSFTAANLCRLSAD